MAVTLCDSGAVVYVTAGGTVAVPTDAEGVVFLWSALCDSGGQTLASLTLSGTAWTPRLNAPDAAPFRPAHGAQTGVVSSTGNQTLAFSFTGTPTEGPVAALVFVKGITTSNFFGAVDGDAQDGTTGVSAAVASVVDGLVIAFHQRFGAFPTAPAGWTQQGGGASNAGEGGMVFTIAGSGSTITFTGQGTANYDSLAVVALIPPGAGGPATARLMGGWGM